MQTERTRVPYPWTWEIPALIGVALIAAAILAAQLGRAAANLAAGAGWTWPSRGGVISSLPGVMMGDGAAGLSQAPARIAPAGVVVGWVIALELVTIVAVMVAGVWAARRWGPGRMRGMATIPEAQKVLGLERLRRNAAIIRPDLSRPELGGHDGYHPRA